VPGDYDLGAFAFESESKLILINLFRSRLELKFLAWQFKCESEPPVPPHSDKSFVQTAVEEERNAIAVGRLEKTGELILARLT
jgi:hypothetical protein